MDSSCAQGRAKYGYLSKKSRFLYVQSNGKGRKWRAVVRVDNRKYDAGTFSDEVEAAHAADALALKLKGSAAVLNFPPSGQRTPQKLPRKGTVLSRTTTTDVQDSQGAGVEPGSSSAAAVPAAAPQLDPSASGVAAAAEGPSRAGVDDASQVQIQALKYHSKYQGVTRMTRTLRWVAQIAHGGKMIYGGSFASEEEAARAYDVLALRLKGSDAALNFPEDRASSLAKTAALTLQDGKPCKAKPKACNYRGVTINPHASNGSGRFQVFVCHNNKTISGGTFHNEEVAARMYDKLALKIKGSKAKLNFPPAAAPMLANIAAEARGCAGCASAPQLGQGSPGGTTGPRASKGDALGRSAVRKRSPGLPGSAGAGKRMRTTPPPSGCSSSWHVCR